MRRKCEYFDILSNRLSLLYRGTDPMEECSSSAVGGAAGDSAPLAPLATTGGASATPTAETTAPLAVTPAPAPAPATLTSPLTSQVPAPVVSVSPIFNSSPPGASASTDSDSDTETMTAKLSQLQALGFSEQQATMALTQSGGDVNLAATLLLSSL